ncbi:cytochrome b/b6 domain-containing protein [Telmatospirillum sp. J64-1]|uniref:cytochrome b/b6 domain-containing protein n=1 Tax=Telmatospirillum sp. J64-1 TaxID=2502183 RepID=UPI00115DF49D|nr:cytochrome b/b6 domain-containing protein [Telmatospirillum sp. J64-1]
MAQSTITTADSGAKKQAAPERKLRVWDLPTRLFHWTLVVLVVLLFLSGKQMTSLLHMDHHMLLGYAVLALVLFRILWGFIGSTHSRFADFLRGPYAVRNYLKGQGFVAGHNPIGGWMVMALLGILTVQGVTGLFASDDIWTDGPLVPLVSSATVSQMTSIHKTAVDILLILVGLHVAAAFFYLLVKRDNLIKAMITGYKTLPPDQPAPAQGRFVHPLLALAALALAAAVIWAVVTLLP